ncbi:MAG: hypothetical protein MR006_03740 [Arcanobacterium sp.]|nr:hypothetical protein [Arcanobacterium sp.]MDY5589531.1 hypothetical protein [Arcanobacterium sp.]
MVLTALVLIGMELPAYAVSQAQADAWFSSQGHAVVVAQASQVFPTIAAKDRQQLTMGTAVNVWGVNTADGGRAAIGKSSYWAASIAAANAEPLGAIVVNYSSGSAKNAQVIADPKLANRVNTAGADAHGAALVYDEKLKVWYTVDKELVSAASTGASVMIAGAVPLRDFFAQRARNLGLVKNGSADTNQVPAAPLQPDRDVEGAPAFISPVGVVITVLIIAALLTISLLWLRWESHHPQGRAAPAGESASLAPDTGSFSIVEADGESTSARLGKASGKVRVFRRSTDTAHTTNGPGSVGNLNGAKEIGAAGSQQSGHIEEE